jgi:tetratricopeptide (TPR) repeat protein
MLRTNGFWRWCALALVLAGAPSGARGQGAQGAASASVKVSIQAEVKAGGKADAVTGDKLFASGDFAGALSAYGAGFAKTRDAAFVYAMAQCHKAMGHTAEAETMFKMYLAAGSGATLTFKAEAEAELGMGAKAAGGRKGQAVGMAMKAKGKVVDLVGEAGAGIYGTVKVSVAASVSASAKAEAQAGDAAYAGGKWADAAKSWGVAYAKSQSVLLLYAQAQARAQAGQAIEARALLVGYLAAQPKKFVKEAKALLLALGGSAETTVKVAVKGKVSKVAQASAGKADAAFKAGKYLDAAKLYGEAHAAAPDAALLYARGMAEYCAGLTAEASASLGAYLAAGGSLEFKVEAQATLRAAGGAGA